MVAFWVGQLGLARPSHWCKAHEIFSHHQSTEAGVAKATLVPMIIGVLSDFFLNLFWHDTQFFFSSSFGKIKSNGANDNNFYISQIYKNYCTYRPIYQSLNILLQVLLVENHWRHARVVTSQYNCGYITPPAPSSPLLSVFSFYIPSKIHFPQNLFFSNLSTFHDLNMNMTFHTLEILFCIVLFFIFYFCRYIFYAFFLSLIKILFPYDEQRTVIFG